MIVATVAFAVAVAIPRIYAPDVSVEGYEKVPPPNIQMRMNEASATTVPWIDSNASRFGRGLGKAFYANLPAGSAALAAAEAHAWGVDAILQPASEDVDKVNAMLSFLKRIDAPRMPARANIGITDDGSKEMAEALNLLNRRNLLYRVVAEPDRKLDLSIRIGSAQYPRGSLKNPNDFAARVREKLSDEKRLVRLFGTYTVLVNLTGDENRARLYLINYSRRPVKDVRVRILGQYRGVRLFEANDPDQVAKDTIIVDRGTEFTIPLMTTYAVVDLQAKQN